MDRNVLVLTLAIATSVMDNPTQASIPLAQEEAPIPKVDKCNMTNCPYEATHRVTIRQPSSVGTKKIDVCFPHSKTLTRGASKENFSVDPIADFAPIHSTYS